MREYFYNFTFEGTNRGYSYLYVDSLDDTDVTNAFALRISRQNVIACKHDDLDWVDLSQHPQDHFPSCAYPLLLPRVQASTYSYIQISEDDGSVIGKIQLRRNLCDIVEYSDDKILRRFTMEGETPIRIDWGGAISYLCSNAQECVRHSGLTFAFD